MSIAQTLTYLLPNAEWSLTGNDYTTLQWFGLGDPPTMEELQQAWDELQTIKIWPNSQAFLSEFTMQEMAAISLSTDQTIAAMRLLLSVWFSEVHSNDERVINSLNKLIELNIITEDRKNKILSKQ